MTRIVLTVLILLLSFFGLADSWYLAESALTHTPLSCNIEGLGDCNVVAGSPYSQFFGIPLALFGVAFYTLLFVFSALLLFVRTRQIYLSLLVFASLGFLASLYFMFLQLFVIKATCIYCLTSAILSAFIFACALVMKKRFRKSSAVLA
jgi:uncharacterized membrane protein